MSSTTREGLLQLSDYTRRCQITWQKVCIDKTGFVLWFKLIPGRGEVPRLLFLKGPLKEHLLTGRIMCTEW